MRKKKIKYEEELGDVDVSLFTGTFDEVLENLKSVKEWFLRNYPLGTDEEFVLEFDPFVDVKDIRDMVVYRRAWGAEKAPKAKKKAKSKKNKR